MTNFIWNVVDFVIRVGRRFRIHSMLRPEHITL